MIKLELKKLHKSKLILITILLSIIMSFYVNYISNNTQNLNSEYGSYGYFYPLSIFSSNFSKNEYKLQKYKNYGVEYNKMYKYHYRNYPKLMDFMSNIDKKTFKEKYDISKEFFYLEYDKLRDAIEYNKKYGLEIEDENDLKSWKYGIFEMEYIKENDLHTNIGYFEFLSTNYVRRIIYNSKIIFGIPFLFFVILVFYGILSKEREDGTINLLKTQPINYRKLVISKLISMNLISIIYFSSFLIFFALICFVQGINLGGFSEIYRIFYDGIAPKYFKGYELILLILFSFTIIMNLIYSIILLINTIFRNKYASLASLISIFGLGYTFTENIHSLKTVFNPIYAMDHVRSIKGKIENVVEKNGAEVFKNINYNSLIYLLMFLILSSFLVIISIKLLKYDFRFYNKEKEIDVKKYSIFKFEVRKIANNQSFVIYLLATLILVFSLHFFEANKANSIRNYKLGEKGKINDYEEELERNNKLFNNKKYTEKDIASYKIKELTQKIKNYNKLINSYKANNTLDFYKAEKVEDENLINSVAIYSIEKEINKTPMTLYENKLVNEISIKNNIKPIIKGSPIFSEYQTYGNILEEKFNKQTERYGTNSGIYTTYRMLRYQDLDIIFLGIIMFMIMHGYVSEKENGNQLNMIYTQPINRFKYNITKVFSQTYVLLIFCFVIFIFAVLNGVITEGFGEIKQPVIHYLTYAKNFNSINEKDALKTISTMPIWQYLSKTFIVMILQGFLISSIATLISIYTKSKNMLIALTSAIMVLGVILTNILNVNAIKLYSPFSYLFANKVADNSVMVRNVIIGGNFTTSILVLIIWGLIFIVIGSMISSKRKQKV
ncbi:MULTISPECIES: ABC transporter permease subunit [Helcococcus]|uniref:ABC transporter permease subunit n=1 Tax=Helcococcus bovis TaxID=3153252 RepID=A0ABW9F7E0_9FIRM